MSCTSSFSPNIIFFQALDCQSVVCFAFAFAEICARLKEDCTTGYSQLQQTCILFNQSGRTKTKCDVTHTCFPAPLALVSLYVRLAKSYRIFFAVGFTEVLIGLLCWKASSED